MAQDNWDDLRLFLAVARAESLTAAGRQLRLDPATLGRRIARLETRLGADLFEKSPQGYALTESGHRLLAPLEMAEVAMTDAVSSASAQDQGLTGLVRIGAPDGCANFLLPGVVADLQTAHPDLDLQIVALPRVFNLSKREADMAIGVSPPASGRMRVQKITDYRLHLGASAAYLAAHDPIRTLADLRGHRTVGYIPDMIFDKELDYLDELGVTRVEAASNSVSVQFQMIRAGAGIGVVHDFAFASDPDMRRILADQLSLTRSFYLIRPETDRRITRLNRLAEALVAGMRAQVLRLEARVRDHGAVGPA